TTLALGGRFAFLPEGIQRAEQRFNFAVTVPTTRFRSARDFPWQAHFAGLGLLMQARWYDRLTPSQGGDNRVAACSRPSRRRLRPAAAAESRSSTAAGAGARRAGAGRHDGRRHAA